MRPTARWSLIVVMTANAVAGLTVVLGSPAADEPVGPPGFPDLTAYTRADPGRYRHAGAWAGAPGELVFATPGGLQCVMYDGPAISAAASCQGDIPGLPDSASPGHMWERCPSIMIDSGSSEDRSPWYVFRQRSGGYFPRGSDDFVVNEPCPSSFDSARLAIGEKIAGAHITCAVGTRDLVACINPLLNHGFVLQRSGSWVF